MPRPGVFSPDFAPTVPLWAGTQSGVVRYSGTEWTTYPLAGGQAGVVYDAAVAETARSGLGRARASTPWLFLALDTVKGHNRHIFDKLQVQRRTEAIARARGHGLL